MAAPKKNQFWKLRSRHGRQKLFSDPDLLWQAATEYFDWVDSNHWYKNELIKGGDKAGRIFKVPTQRPYTLTGLCLYLDCNTAYFRQFKNALPEGEQGFSTIITRIEEVIYTQKYEGAVVGAFNASIVARDLGLVDKKDVTTDGESLNKELMEQYQRLRAINDESTGTN